MNINVLDAQLYVVARLIDENFQLRNRIEQLEKQVSQLAVQVPEKAEA